jgi:hypothetical protein
MAVYVRLCTIPRLAREMCNPVQKIYGVQSLDYGQDTVKRLGAQTGWKNEVLADALLVQGHWLGEALAVWSSKTLGHGRRKKAAELFVDAVPAPQSREPTN